MEHIRKNKISYRVLFIFTIVLSVMLSAFVSGCSKKEAQSNYERGIECLKLQNYSAALDYFNTAEVEEKDLKLIYRGKGLAYLGLAEYNNAVYAFETALSQSNGLIKPVDYDINFYLATAEYKNGNLQRARKTYTSVIELKESADAYYLRGKVILDMDEYEQAVSDYDKAISLDKENARLYINIYNDLMEHGYENEAKGYINRAVANIPKPSSYELALFNYYLGDYTQARNYFESSSDTKKTEEGIIYLGKTYEAIGDSGYAASLYEDYSSRDAAASEVFNELGLLRFAEKDYEGALKAFEAGLQNENASCRQSLMYNQIITYEFLNNFSKANELMKTYLKLYPDDEAALREDVFLRTR